MRCSKRFRQSTILLAFLLAKKDGLRREGSAPSLAGKLTAEDPRGDKHNARDVEVVATMVGVNIEGGATLANPLEFFRPTEPADNLGGLESTRDRDEVGQIGSEALRFP